MPTAVPASWMPQCQMKRIHIHWTAGGYIPNTTDKDAYHLLVDGEGKIHRGNKAIDANEDGKPKSSMAHHTLNANSGAIGISICSMAKAKEYPFIPGPSPMKKIQWEAMIDTVAQLSLRYGIPVSPTTVLTHAEVQPNLNIKQKSKWDITRLLFYPNLIGPAAIGDKMRLEIAIVRDGMQPKLAKPFPNELKMPRYKISGVSPSTLNVRRDPGGEKVGELPEGTIVERIAAWGNWFQIRTPKGHVGWVSSSFLKDAN